MLDFLKDMSLASHGVDIDAVSAIKAERREQKKLGRFIFSIRAKIVVCVLAALYIAVTIYGMTRMSRFTFDFALDILFVVVALGTVVCLWVLGKKGEVISLCGIIGLLICLYIRQIV